MKIHLTGKQLLDMMSEGVYYWKRGDRYLYIGSSTNMLWRVSRHNLIDRVEPILDKDDLLFLPTTNSIAEEEIEIANHRPLYNPERPKLGAKKTERVCPACQTRFMQKRPHQIWCSLQCRQGTY